MGCFTKFFLFVLNFIVFGIGIGVIVLASLVLSHTKDFEVLLSNGTFTVPIVLLILGIFVMLLGFFGCFGALRESPCLLYTYASIVLLLFIGQVAVVTYGLVKKDEVSAQIAQHMSNVFDKYGGDDVELTKSLDASQQALKCCGVYGYQDWKNGNISGSNIENGGDVALGCCRDMEDPNCNIGIADLTPEDAAVKIYTKGCYPTFVDTIKDQALWLIIGAISLGLLQLGCVVIACGIGKKASRDVYY